MAARSHAGSPGATGEQRADHQLGRLRDAGLHASVRLGGLNGGATLRLGPLAHDAAWLALQAFLGRPLSVDIERRHSGRPSLARAAAIGW